MADEPSPEAIVAAEAAAGAVEELHAREAVDEAALTATITAEQASYAAAEAQISSAAANESAVAAGDMAAAASDQASEAQQQVEQMFYATADQFASHEERTDQRLREMREYIDSRIALPEPTPNGNVEEVEVNAGRVHDSGTGSDTAAAGEEGTDSSTGAPEKQSERYGLRHRRR